MGERDRQRAVDLAGEAMRHLRRFGYGLLLLLPIAALIALLLYSPWAFIVLVSSIAIYVLGASIDGDLP